MSRPATRWPPGCCGCTRSGCSWRPGKGGWPNTSRRHTPPSPWPKSRHSPRTSMTSRACARSVQASPANQISASGSTRHQVVHVVYVLLVAVTSLLQQLAPGLHVGAPAKQRTALPLGHAAPDAELNAVVQCVGQAFGPHQATPADELGSVLRCALDEQLVRVGSFAGGACGPVSDPHVCPLLLIVAYCVHGRSMARWRDLASGSLGTDPGYRFVIKQPTEDGGVLPRPRSAHLRNSPLGPCRVGQLVTFGCLSACREPYAMYRADCPIRPEGAPYGPVCTSQAPFTRAAGCAGRS